MARPTGQTDGQTVNTATGELMEGDGRGTARSRRRGAPAHAGEVVVVTGMSGAGRSTAAKELEDLGCFVVDNLPPSLLRDVVDLVDESRGTTPADRGGRRRPVRLFFDTLQADLAQHEVGRRTTLLFLDATDEVLVRRQEAARRPHPLQASGRLVEGLRREREVLANLRADADLVIDTSDLNVHQLTDRIAESFGDAPHHQAQGQRHQLRLQVRHPGRRRLRGRLRFLPNPYWVPTLRGKTGRSSDVSDYVLGQPGARSSSTPTSTLLRGVAEGYRREGKRFMAVADRLHRRQAPQRGDDRGDRPRSSARPATTWLGCTVTSDVSDLTAAPGRTQVTALGGGHGLFASLSALRRLPVDLTAVVTVADDGGSSRAAALRVRRPAPRRPADGAGGAVRRRRVGRDLGQGAPAPLRAAPARCTVTSPATS